MNRMMALALALVGGCTVDPMTNDDPAQPDPTGDYTVHRQWTSNDACPPYQEPVDFSLSIDSVCATSPVTETGLQTCEPITASDGAFEFELSERWNGDVGLPAGYPTYVIPRVSYTLHLVGNVLVGTADGSYNYDTPTSGGDCDISWDVTATRN